MYDNEKEATVIALKMKDGTDILGYYLGQVEEQETQEGGVILYRPVMVSLVSGMSNRGPYSMYTSRFYFPYSEPDVCFTESLVLHQGMASTFYSNLYKHLLADLNESEQDRMEQYEKIFSRIELKNVMGDSDSMFVEPQVKIIQ